MSGLTPLKAIRLKCLDCSAGSSNEVKFCRIFRCSLYPYRSGHNPARKGVGNSKISQLTARKRNE